MLAGLWFEATPRRRVFAHQRQSWSAWESRCSQQKTATHVNEPMASTLTLQWDLARSVFSMQTHFVWMPWPAVAYCKGCKCKNYRIYTVDPEITTKLGAFSRSLIILQTAPVHDRAWQQISKEFHTFPGTKDRHRGLWQTSHWAGRPCWDKLDTTLPTLGHQLLETFGTQNPVQPMACSSPLN